MFLILTILISLFACRPDSTPQNIFSYEPSKDAKLTRMLQWQSAGMLDSISLYLTHRQPAYRYQAAKILASVDCTDEQKNMMTALLADTSIMVAEITAYTLGQQKDKNLVPHLKGAFKAYDSTQIYQVFNANILEAVGKCGGRDELNLLTGIRTYDHEDSVLVLGQCRGIFQLLLKDVSSDQSIQLMSNYFLNKLYPSDIRTLAGYYFARNKKLDIAKYSKDFIRVLKTDLNPVLRAYAAMAMVHSGSEEFVSALTERASEEKEDMVRINIVRALTRMKYKKSKEAIFKLAEDKNVYISREASRFFLEKGSPEDAATYWDIVEKKKLDPLTELNFAAATIKNLPFYYALTLKAAESRISKQLKNSKTPKEKTLVMRALAELPTTHLESFASFYKQDAHPLVKTAFVNGLGTMATGIEKIKSRRKKRAFYKHAADLLDTVVVDGDIGAIAALSSVLRDTTSHRLKYHFDQHRLLYAKLQTLNLPEEMETYNELVDLLNVYNYGLRKKKPLKYKPFNVSLFKKISDSTTISIETSRGPINIKLHAKRSPLSAVNFLELAQSGYFDGKTFHRVVPNFVIQSGCPRGDGYGSLDFSIRSELGPSYYSKPGLVGMASAGLNTECSQWFITHIPTPHLDGRYTIFGEVVLGQNVIDQIQVGDKIIKTTIYNLNNDSN